jgi:hypothetical protein
MVPVHLPTVLGLANQAASKAGECTSGSASNPTEPIAKDGSVGTAIRSAPNQQRSGAARAQDALVASRASMPLAD